MGAIDCVLVLGEGGDRDVDLLLEAVGVGLDLLDLWGNVCLVVWVEIGRSVRSALEVGFAETRRIVVNLGERRRTAEDEGDDKVPGGQSVSSQHFVPSASSHARGNENAGANVPRNEACESTCDGSLRLSRAP